jgi:hypothetical protein
MKKSRKMLFIEDEEKNAKIWIKSMEDLGFEVVHIRFLPLKASEELGQLKISIDHERLNALLMESHAVVVDGLLKHFLMDPLSWGSTCILDDNPPPSYPELANLSYAKRLRERKVKFEFNLTHEYIQSDKQLISQIRTKFSGPMVAWSSLEFIRESQVKSGCDYSIEGVGKSSDQLVKVLNRMINDNHW